MEKKKPLSPIWENILVDAIDNKGRYDALKFAELLDWTKRKNCPLSRQGPISDFPL